MLYCFLVHLTIWKIFFYLFLIIFVWISEIHCSYYYTPILSDFFFFYFLVFFKSFHDSTFEPKQLWLESKHGWMKTKGHNQIKWYKCKQYLKSQIQINIKPNWNDTSCKGKATGEYQTFLETAKTGLILRVWICNITTNMAAPQI